MANGAFSLHRTSSLPRTGRSRRTSDPLKWNETASSDRPPMLSWMSDCLSPRDKINSSTNQMIFRRVPSNIHSLPVAH